MAGVNKVILIGNLGKDPEVRHLESGVAEANFPIATTETFKSKDGNKTDHTEWHNIVLWRGLAEISEKYLKKGDKVYIEGRLRTRQWDDKDGNKRYTTEILCDNMTMLGGNRDSSNSGNSAQAKVEEPPPQEQKKGDDLPF